MLVKFENLLKELVAEYKLQENVIGLLLFGSLSKGCEHTNSDIDLMVIAKETKDKTTNKLYGDIMVQALWRNRENFREKTAKKTRFAPGSQSYKVLFDKENWIEDYLNSDIIKEVCKEPLPLNNREKLLMSTDFSSSLDTLDGLNEQGKYIEVDMFIYDYIYLGLELLYNENKWFLKTKKYIISDVKNRLPKLWNIINGIYNSTSAKIKLENYREFYSYIIESLDKVDKEYTIYW